MHHQIWMRGCRTQASSDFKDKEIKVQRSDGFVCHASAHNPCLFHSIKHFFHHSHSWFFPHKSQHFPKDFVWKDVFRLHNLWRCKCRKKVSSTSPVIRVCGCTKPGDSSLAEGLGWLLWYARENFSLQSAERQIRPICDDSNSEAL